MYFTRSRLSARFLSLVLQPFNFQLVMSKQTAALAVLASGMLYQNSANFVLQDAHVEWPVGESMTEPDLSLTIPELLDRHARGLPLPFYEADYSELDLPDFDAMDLVEIAEYRENLAAHIYDLQEEQRLAALHHERKDLNVSLTRVQAEGSDVEESTPPKDVEV